MTALPLEGQTALITGAARRIGRSVALRLAAEGADIAVHYRSSKEGAEQTAKEISTHGRKVEIIQGDVTRGEDVRRIFAETEAKFGRLDILVNNAGVFFHAPFNKLTEAQWDRALNTNLKSQFLCAQAAAPLLKKNGRGVIVNFSSLGGLLAWPGYVHYCVSKAGVIMLTRCLAKDLAPEIRVNAVAPGTISMPGDPPEWEADYIRHAPLHRTGKPEDIAGAVFFLIQSEFVTGQVLVVDGGRTL